MMINLKLIKDQYLEKYTESQKIELEIKLQELTKKTSDLEDFGFYFANAAVYSSNIEGNSLNFDSYLKNMELKMNLKTKEVKEINDLIAAYEFAKNNEISMQNLLKSHEILSKTVIAERKYRGKLRKVKVGVRGEGKLIYLAVEPEYVKEELDKLLADIAVLLKKPLSVCEVFYYASMIHLAFVYIHPFADGNGRTTRLLEKWFLAKKLGESAWFIKSERNYFKNRAEYYQNLQLGGNYYVINYGFCLPFLLMLPNALILD